MKVGTLKELDVKRSFHLFADGNAYRVKPEPVREKRTIRHSYKDSFVNHHYEITFDAIEGKADCASIKMEEI